MQSGTANHTDAFNPDTGGLSPTQLAQLPAIECPIGYWGEGNATAAKCQSCPIGSSTEQPGSTSAADCICTPGYGIASDTASSCTVCPYGSFQPALQMAQCQACPNATFYAPVDGLGEAWTSSSTTFSTGKCGFTERPIVGNAGAQP